MKSINISEIMNGAWLERALYTAEERGIPAFADGLKPVQRFLICKALKAAKNQFEKVATIATIATEGYHHGEASSAAALIGMAADYSNNLPIFDGDGNFGNVLDPSPGAPRYIYAKLSPLFELLYKDQELCPAADDPEHIPPKYYLPIIPMVLINGIKGIATGYATDIPPHDPISVIDWLIERTKTKKPKTSINPKYYGFSGTVTKGSDHYRLSGTYEFSGANKIRITELPRGITCTSYDSLLKKLQEKGAIVDYDNRSRMNQFDYLVTFRRGTKLDDAEIRKILRLDINHTWNLTTVSLEGKIQEWSKTTGIQDIAEAFYGFRLSYVAERIRRVLERLEEQERYLSALRKFCSDIIESKFSFKGITDDELSRLLLEEYKAPESSVQKIMNMPVRTFTVQKIQKVDAELQETKDSIDYYRKTSPEAEYTKDLSELKKAYKKYTTENA